MVDNLLNLFFSHPRCITRIDLRGDSLLTDPSELYPRNWEKKEQILPVYPGQYVFPIFISDFLFVIAGSITSTGSWIQEEASLTGWLAGRSLEASVIDPIKLAS